MVDGFKEVTELRKVFSEIEEVLHNWEMIALGEQVEMSCKKLQELFIKAADLVIIKVNYTQHNLLKFKKYEQRLSHLLNPNFEKNIDLTNNPKEANRILAICSFLGQIEDLMDEFLLPFCDRHNIVDPEEKPLFFDSERHIELSKLHNSENTIIDSKTFQESKTEFPKLTWKGTPAQFAFIINLLQEKGYIASLTPYGERNAKLLLMLFDIEGYNATPESLGKCFQSLKKDELPINKEDAAKFQKIPHRNELKK